MRDAQHPEPEGVPMTAAERHASARELYEERAAPLLQAGVVSLDEPDLIHADARLDTLAVAGDAWAVQSYLGGSNGLALALALEPRVLPVGAHGCNQYEYFMINIFIHKFN